MALLDCVILIFLEMTFIFVALCLLLQQRRAIGMAPFYIVFGVLLLFGLFFGAGDFVLNFGEGWVMHISGVLIHAPLLAAFLALYIICGVWHAQHLIIAIACAGGVCWYVFELTYLQCNWEGFELTGNFLSTTLAVLINKAGTYGKLRFPFLLIDLFVVPLVFRQLEKWKVNLCSALTASLLSAVLLESLTHYLAFKLFNVGTVLGAADMLGIFAALFWLGMLLALVLHWLERDLKLEKAGPLDLFFAFLGSYRRAKELESDIRETEDKYHIVLDNAGELIVLMTPEGAILDLNQTASRVLGLPEYPNQNVNLFDRLKVIEGEGNSALTEAPDTLRRFHCELDSDTPEVRHLSLSLSPVRLHGRLLVLMIAQDVTEELRLAQSREELEEQLQHSRRLESLGKLAGGIAHDFNNCIHSILGHIDLARLTTEDIPPKLDQHLENVTQIAEQAGELTSRLLGFARKGKYRIVPNLPDKLLRDCLSMLGPSGLADVDCDAQVLPGTPGIMGDPAQLRQLVLNLLLNAVDSMRNLPAERRKLTVHIAPAELSPIPFVPGVEYPDAKCSDYVVISVTDRGCGMDEAVAKQIFEPFFTTKPAGKGTGMGLAMVYGTVTNHRGWVQLKSTRDAGSCFCVFIPGAGSEDKENI